MTEETLEQSTQKLLSLVEGYTPGPWKWINIKGFAADRYIVPADYNIKDPLYKPHTYDVIIAKVHHGFSTCNLVAAAPEMVELIKALSKENAALRSLLKPSDLCVLD